MVGLLLGAVLGGMPTANARRNTMASIKIRSGIEGPRPDPYGWSEMTVTRGNHTFTLRTSGLGHSILTIDNRRYGVTFHNFDRGEKWFAKLTGATVQQWYRWHAMLEARTLPHNYRPLYSY